MAHLALLDRDFNEADYEMLLQLDEVDGLGRNTLHHALGARATAPGSELLPWLLAHGAQARA